MTDYDTCPTLLTLVTQLLTLITSTGDVIVAAEVVAVEGEQLQRVRLAGGWFAGGWASVRSAEGAPLLERVSSWHGPGGPGGGVGGANLAVHRERVMDWSSAGGDMQAEMAAYKSKAAKDSSPEPMGLVEQVTEKAARLGNLRKSWDAAQEDGGQVFSVMQVPTTPNMPSEPLLLSVPSQGI